MKRFSILMIALMLVALIAPAGNAAKPAAAQDDKIVVYMQMGGTQGDASTLARTNGARAAAEALGIELHEQYSGWDNQTMLDQFNEALAASPDGIVIMGHPGEDAYGPLVDQAEAQGIIVTSGNNPLPNIEAKYQTAGFGYAGADLYQGGYLTGKSMVAAGLQSGDEAMIYDIWHEEGRSVSAQGMYDALTEAGLTVEKLDVSQEVNSDVSLAVPILTAYIEAHPDLKAIGTQHGNITANMMGVLQAEGLAPAILSLVVSTSRPRQSKVSRRATSVSASTRCCICKAITPSSRSG